MIIGDRKYVEIPGNKEHELPPLMIHRTLHWKRLDKIVHMAQQIVEGEEMIPPSPLPEEIIDSRKLDLAIQLVEQYQRLLLHWRWGDDVLEWIRQCEITFESRAELRNLLKRDIWPHAGPSSFVQLLEDKAVPTEGIRMETAVGLRLTFRQPPQISCFSNQFLFYLKDSVGPATYQAWASLNPAPVSDLPPERFCLQVVEM